jgi:hypothetical protein
MLQIPGQFEPRFTAGICIRKSRNVCNNCHFLPYLSATVYLPWKNHSNTKFYISK